VRAVLHRARARAHTHTHTHVTRTPHDQGNSTPRRWALASSMVTRACERFQRTTSSRRKGGAVEQGWGCCSLKKAWQGDAVQPHAVLFAAKRRRFLFCAAGSGFSQLAAAEESVAPTLCNLHRSRHRHHHHTAQQTSITRTPSTQPRTQPRTHAHTRTHLCTAASSITCQHFCCGRAHQCRKLLMGTNYTGS
jgi:hypothetical protein